ncbi:zinc ion binding [Forsythia ovata]|uniref:Zinc finger protein 830 n=1 Tax=Forsythia ovata TaxID=205694 RepID=A0ABD1UA97_9LAMI
MDVQAKKKSLFRAKLNAQKQEKQRIDSPLVRYNEHDHLFCRVCDVFIKSESLWPAHQASRKHHEAIDNLKANAAALNRANNSKPVSPKELPKPNSEHYQELHKKSEPSTALPEHRSSSSLPPDFFDNHETKKQKNGSRGFSSEHACWPALRISGKLGHHDSHNKNDVVSGKTQMVEPFVLGSETDGSSIATSVENRDSEIQASKEIRQVSKVAVDSEAKKVKGPLPEGFFDDKDADLRARGITPVKPDVKDEYKEFEKLIQEDLQEIDNRLEEEEFDAAETIEEAESLEQRTYRERVEILRRKKLEIKSARSVISSKGTEVTQEVSSPEESSSGDDNDNVLTVDWRAKHL